MVYRKETSLPLLQKGNTEEMKSILQSIKPVHCENIAAGIKKYELRKTRPKCELPFKVYIYCTKDKLLTKSHNNGNIYVSENKYKSALEKAGNLTLSGKVIGEYVCDEITEISADNLIALYFNNPINKTCISDMEMRKYANGKKLYLWHISNLVIYDKPKELSEFLKYGFEDAYSSWEDLFTIGVNGCGTVIYPPEPKEEDWRLTRPPQSWCYVEEV